MAQTKKQTKPAASAAKSAVAEIEATMEKANAEFSEFFSAQGIEVPEYVRSASEKAIAGAREGYAKFKTAAEDATDLLEETFETARDGALDLQNKTLDAAKDNTDSAFAFAKDIMKVSSPADAIQLQTAFMRDRFEAMMDYARTLQETATGVAEATAKPTRDAFAKYAAEVKAS